MSDPVSRFQEAMAYKGIICLEPIIADGEMHTFHVDGDKPGSKNGRYQLYMDSIPSAWYGSWKLNCAGNWFTWCDKSREDMSPQEREQFRNRIEEGKATREQEQAEKHALGRSEASHIWCNAKPETGAHRYLRDKGVQAHGIRTDGHALIIPLRDTQGVLHSIQSIYPNSDKILLTGGKKRGHYHAIGKPDGLLYICEGYATGASIHDATGHAVAIAFDAGNLKPVAIALRSKYPDLRLIIAGDNDQWTEDNPGVRYATEAAQAVNGELVIPEFRDLATKPTDWNDLVRLEGADVVCQLLSNPATPYQDTTSDDIQMVCAADVKPEPVRWLWPGRLAIGKVSMIAGDPGLGKSLVTLAIASGVSRGTPWPVDHSNCPTGDVLILSAEDDAADTIVPRLIAASADLRRIHLLNMVRTIDRETGEFNMRSFSIKQDIKKLEEILKNNPECHLVVIDPISAYLDGTDSHKNSDIRGLLSPLSDMASRLRVAILAVTHFNKGGQASALYRMTGSLAFVAAARSAWAVTKDKEDSQRRLVLPAKNNLGGDTSGLAYRVVTGEGGLPVVGWESEPVTITADEAIMPDDEARSERQDAAEWLKEVLADGALKVKDLRRMADDAGHSWRTVQRAKKVAGVLSKQYDFRGPHYWLIAPQDATEPTECQPNTVAHCGQSGALCDETEAF